MLKKTDYMLSKLMEESGEVTQAASKVLIFGADDIWCTKGKTNREVLIDEINDFWGVVCYLSRLGVLPEDFLSCEKIVNKQLKLDQFLKYAQGRGIVEADK
jgi:NTP pyrophosphatase (non-canonical NTP hydrolase)